MDAHQYTQSVPEDLSTKLNGGIVFTKIDLSDAFLQLEVEEESQELHAINNHKGLFRFNRPYSDLTNHILANAMLLGLKRVAVDIDDIIAAAASLDELLLYGFRVKAERVIFPRQNQIPLFYV